MDEPLISVIIISTSNRAELQPSLDSLACQVLDCPQVQ
jgi:hypothetical protein